MESDAENDQTPESEPLRAPIHADTEIEGMRGRIELIESQPIDERARGFEQLHDELLLELQRSDREGA